MKSCSVLEIFCFYISNHLMNFEICDVRMSINTVDKVLFWIHLLDRTSLGNETWPTRKCSYEQCFRKNTAWFGGLSPKSRSLLTYQHTAIYQKCIWARGFLLFPRYALRRSKIVKIIYCNLADHKMLSFYQNYNGA